MSRAIIIGDLQGCYEEAVELLDKCQATSSDHVIFAGDLLDRGPDNDKCVDLAIHVEKDQGKPSCVLGNHEEKHLWYRSKDESGSPAKVVSRSHIETRKQLQDHHYEYLKKLPLFIKLPEHNAVVIHAGALPGIPIEKQDPYHLLHVQMVDPKDPGKSMWPSKAPEGWVFWTNLWQGPETIIFGHTVFDKPLVTEHAIGIDGGCCFGRELWAVILPERKIVRVPSRTNHKDRAVAQYVVHGDVKVFS